VIDDSSDIALKPEDLAGMIKLVDEGKINHTIAGHKLLPELLKNTGKSAAQLATDLNLFISESGDELNEFILKALAKFPDKVTEYRKGKKGVLGLFMGEIMKQSKGKIDPQKTNQLLVKALENN
jgi:aspartyl-tRNA(Asn)/glutamyl-tRNA(Gln) amidotransferase subunit B